METTPAPSTSYLSQLRLLLEELCCDLCRFEHVARDRLTPEQVSIDREFYLGQPGAFADLRVALPDGRVYFVEVKYGYAGPMLVRHLRRKYGTATPALEGAYRVVLVIDAERRPDWPDLEAQLRGCLRPGLELEVWNEQRLLAALREQFQVELDALTEDRLLDARQAIDRAKTCHAFGAPSRDASPDDPLQAALLWHFGFWRLQQLRETRRLTAREVLPPGLYRGAVVLVADLCSFSSYVRDTREDEIVRHCLTSFYSKARYQIINHGGMIDQFVGDEVIGFFGVPDHGPDCVEGALRAAQSLVHIGNSVSNHWQRHIDRVQGSGGLHIGMAIGDLQMVALRPFSRTHMGAIGDPINVAARLMGVAGASEIVVSNSFYHALGEQSQAAFHETETLEAHNVGRIKGWKLSLKPGA
jgi:class 3 adenylate cyclase